MGKLIEPLEFIVKRIERLFEDADSYSEDQILIEIYNARSFSVDAQRVIETIVGLDNMSEDEFQQNRAARRLVRRATRQLIQSGKLELIPGSGSDELVFRRSISH